MIVVDSSAAVEWLLGLPLADTVGSRLAAEDTLHAPALLDVEVAQVVRRYALRGEITEGAASRAIEALADLDAQRHTHEVLLPLIWRLRGNLTAYDAAFVALAAALRAPLLTLDAKLARAPWPRILGRPVKVELIA